MMRTLKLVLLALTVSALPVCLNAQNYKTDKARSGEGIYRFMVRNGVPYSQKDRFMELNKGKFNRNGELKEDETYRLPVITKEKTKTAKKNSDNNTAASKTPARKEMRHSELFGEKYNDYPIVTHLLDGATYYLVSGHGGIDTGAIDTLSNGKVICEDEYAYDVMLRLARNLLMNDARVFVIVKDWEDGIRDEMYLESNRNESIDGVLLEGSQDHRLNMRIDAIKQLKTKLSPKFERAVFIHIDSRPNRSLELDVSFYHHSQDSTGKQFAETCLNVFRSKYEKRRSFMGEIVEKNDEMKVIKYMAKPEIAIPSVFIELGNIRNTLNQQRILLVNNRQALANWLCEAFIADYKKTKK